MDLATRAYENSPAAREAIVSGSRLDSSHCRDSRCKACAKSMGRRRLGGSPPHKEAKYPLLTTSYGPTTEQPQQSASAPAKRKLS